MAGVSSRGGRPQSGPVDIESMSAARSSAREASPFFSPRASSTADAGAVRYFRSERIRS